MAIYALLDAQEIFLKNKRIIMNHRLSKIKDKQAALDALDYKTDRNLDRAQIQSLAQLNFINAKQNIIITGKTGTGKSYLAQALPIMLFITLIEFIIYELLHFLKRYDSQG